MSRNGDYVFMWIFLMMLPLLYVIGSWFAFEVRNPLCNDAAFFRHFKSVVTWEKLPQYQEPTNDADN